MKRSFRKASAASGLRFTPVRRKADISIKWVKKRHPLKGGTGGAGVVFWENNGVPVAYRTRGRLTFYGAQQYPVPYRNFLYLHEIGHVIGLGHVKAKDEVMAQSGSGPYLKDYGLGDRAGFRVLYDNGKCITEHPSHPLP